MPQIMLELPEGTPLPSPEQREKLERFLLPMLLEDSSPLRKAMDDMGRFAANQGLTEEILNELLSDES